MRTEKERPGVETVEAALLLLQQENSLARWRAGICAGAWAGALLLLLIAISGLRQPTPFGQFSLLASLCLVVLGAVTLPLSTYRAAEALAQFEDVRAVGTLIEALDFAIGENHQAIVHLLTRLLPRLTAADAGILTPAHHRRLKEAILLGDLHQETDFLAAILKSWEQVGEMDVLSMVERFAESAATSPEEQQIREAAQSCLLCLQARREQQRISSTLLRPASGREPERELLHPAHSLSKIEPQQMLRSSHQTQEEL